MSTDTERLRWEVQMMTMNSLYGMGPDSWDQIENRRINWRIRRMSRIDLFLNR